MHYNTYGVNGIYGDFDNGDEIHVGLRNGDTFRGPVFFNTPDGFINIHVDMYDGYRVVVFPRHEITWWSFVLDEES